MTKAQLIEPNRDIEASDSLDWRQLGAVSKIKDQGVVCGSCWAFSVTALTESHHFIKTKELLDLSEQQLVDCVFENVGCEGGTISETFNYIIHNGIAASEEYPYKEKEGKCQSSYVDSTAVEMYGHAWLYGDEENLKLAIDQFGPVGVSINAGLKSFQFYSSGIFDDPDCVTSPNHAVVIVGYDIDNQTGMDYWIIKNSWSDKWGEAGYMRLIRNKNGICGITSYQFFPLMHDNGENDESYILFLFVAMVIGTLFTFACCCYLSFYVYNRCRHRTRTLVITGV